MSHVDPVGVALAGVNVAVAVLLLATVAFALAGPPTTGGTLLFAAVIVIPLLALPYRSLLTGHHPGE